MFASPTLREHVARGMIGIGAMALAFASGQLVLMIPLVIIGLVALRGCPMCWTIGLLETLYNRGQAGRGQAPVQMCATCSPREHTG